MSNILRKAAGLLTLISLPTTPVRAAPVTYHEVAIDGLKLAYREAGTTGHPTIVLLHGFPSSSRMFDALMHKLGNRYHMVAPDYPGFGNSDAPSPNQFAYTFDNIAKTLIKLADSLGLKRFIFFMQDYGAPVGMRMAIARPDSVAGMIFQNGNIYQEGLSHYWEKRKALWLDRGAHEEGEREELLALGGARARHVGTDPNVSAYDPDLWTDEIAFLHRPGQAEIQSDLIYDYRTNIAAYPAWQAWLRAHQPPTLVIWGRYDPAFTTRGATAFTRDLPNAKIAILEAGHFAMDTNLEGVANLTAAFMRKNARISAKTRTD